jgi:alpha-methylacyl-CoA racemase
MMLADHGAQVLRVERIGAVSPAGGDERFNHLHRNRAAVGIDLKSADGLALARQLAARADVLIEGYRPGTMERLGLGPDDLMPLNPGLVYARMTGWGQDGPLAHTAGHDINYLAMTGALFLMNPGGDVPVPPINLVANFGGGGMTMVAGILAALVERAASDLGQVIDAAMIDGASLLMTQVFAWTQMGIWREGRGGNLLDGSAYFYRCYRTACGGWIAVGALEPQFHDVFLSGLGLDPRAFPDHLDPVHWPARADLIAAIIARQPRDSWITRFAGSDACVTPVLSPAEAAAHPVNRARAMHGGTADARQPAPAPRLSRTPASLHRAAALPGEDGAAALADWGVDADRIAQLRDRQVLLAQ